MVGRHFGALVVVCLTLALGTSASLAKKPIKRDPLLAVTAIEKKRNSKNLIMQKLADYAAKRAQPLSKQERKPKTSKAKHSGKSIAKRLNSAQPIEGKRIRPLNFNLVNQSRTDKARRAAQLKSMRNKLVARNNLKISRPQDGKIKLEKKKLRDKKLTSQEKQQLTAAHELRKGLLPNPKFETAGQSFDGQQSKLLEGTSIRTSAISTLTTEGYISDYIYFGGSAYYDDMYETIAYLYAPEWATSIAVDFGSMDMESFDRVLLYDEFGYLCAEYTGSSFFGFVSAECDGSVLEIVVQTDGSIAGETYDGFTINGFYYYEEDLNSAPVAVALASSYSVRQGELVTFDGLDSYDPDLFDGITAYYWDFGDGYGEEGDQLTYSYSTTGYHTVYLTVYDSYGAYSEDSFQIYVAPALSPTANLSVSPATAQVRTNVTASGVGSSNAVYQSIDWGDGDVGDWTEIRAESHQYTELGEYFIYLTVDNGFGGQDTDWESVLILNTPVINSVTPQTVKPGQDLTINGNNFNDADVVYLGDTLLTILSKTNTQIVARVPLFNEQGQAVQSDKIYVGNWQEYGESSSDVNVDAVAVAELLALQGNYTGNWVVGNVLGAQMSSQLNFSGTTMTETRTFDFGNMKYRFNTTFRVVIDEAYNMSLFAEAYTITPIDNGSGYAQKLLNDKRVCGSNNWVAAQAKNVLGLDCRFSEQALVFYFEKFPSLNERRFEVYTLENNQLMFGFDSFWYALGKKELPEFLEDRVIFQKHN